MNWKQMLHSTDKKAVLHTNKKFQQLAHHFYLKPTLNNDKYVLTIANQLSVHD